MTLRKKKIFVLDTNVILHDSSCIYQFQEHDVVVPITVLEELDQFKKGNETLNYHAREFVRSLDSLSGDKLFNGGVKIGTKTMRSMAIEWRTNEARPPIFCQRVRVLGSEVTRLPVNSLSSSIAPRLRRGDSSGAASGSRSIITDILAPEKVSTT